MTLFNVTTARKHAEPIGQTVQQLHAHAARLGDAALSAEVNRLHLQLARMRAAAAEALGVAAIAITPDGGVKPPPGSAG